MEPTNQPLRKENDLPNLHEDMFHVNLAGCIFHCATGMLVYHEGIPRISGLLPLQGYSYGPFFRAGTLPKPFTNRLTSWDFLI